MSTPGPTFFICLIADLLSECRHVAVGSNSPIPAAAALLARAKSGGKTIVSILGSRKHNTFTSLGDLFDCASLGRIDAFFLSPGQIDGQANINMVGIGDYPRFDVRWPGSHGSPLLYMMIPNVILFREEHSRRVLVPKVDFVSAPGVSPSNIYRPGGPSALVTSKAHFSFSREQQKFRLEGVHPGHTVAEVIENTGFDFYRPAAVLTTAQPDAVSVSLLCDQVWSEVAELYPQFAERLRNDAKTALERASAANGVAGHASDLV